MALEFAEESLFDRADFVDIVRGVDHGQSASSAVLDVFLTAGPRIARTTNVDLAGSHGDPVDPIGKPLDEIAPTWITVEMIVPYRATASSGSCMRARRAASERHFSAPVYPRAETLLLDGASRPFVQRRVMTVTP